MKYLLAFVCEFYREFDNLAHVHLNVCTVHLTSQFAGNYVADILRKQCTLKITYKACASVGRRPGDVSLRVWTQQAGKLKIPSAGAQ